MTSTRLSILDVPVDAVDMESALEKVRDMLADDKTNIIVAVNPEKVIAAQKNPDLLSALNNATLVIPDGIGVVVAARILARRSMERVPGSDLMPAICGLAVDENKSIFLYGAKPEIVSEAADELQERYPGLKVAGTQHGYVSEDEMAQLVESINVSGADILFVGLGSPRQELWMSRFQESLEVKVCQGVGGTFDALCGYPKRAPQFMQKLHLEWLYRLVTQPKRAHRQLALPRFAIQVFTHFITRKS